jgi:hypothetical protein
MSEHMIERTTVRLPEELLRRAKRKAAAEGRTLTSLIEDGLRLIVSEKRPAAKQREVSIPVSSATGGFRPGMESLTFSQLEELDDLEYIERLRTGFR